MGGVGLDRLGGGENKIPQMRFLNGHIIIPAVLGDVRHTRCLFSCVTTMQELKKKDKMHKLSVRADKSPNFAQNQKLLVWLQISQPTHLETLGL